MVEHQQNSKSSAPMIVTGLIMILLFCGFAFFLVSQGQSIPNVEQLREETRLKNLADLNAENQKVLTQYHWVDKSKGIVGIPIDQAMRLYVERQAAAGPAAAPAGTGEGRVPTDSAPVPPPALSPSPTVSPSGDHP